MNAASVNGGGGLVQVPSAGAAEQRPATQSASPSATGRKTYLSLTGVAAKFGVSVRTAHKIVDEGWFPQPVQLLVASRGNRRWVEQEIDLAVETRAPRQEGKKEEPASLRSARGTRYRAQTGATNQAAA